MSERTLTGVGMPPIEECPECGSDWLYTTTITVNCSTLKLDGYGGVSNWHDEVLQDALIMSAECGECEVPLIEDAESAHEEIDV
jgi:hypothetical protein